MFAVGDVIEMFAPTASKKKYHLCVCEPSEDGVQRFLFINSGSGYEADLVLEDGEIGGLPASPTGNTIISCSLLLRYNVAQLSKFKAVKIGSLNVDVASKLASFIATSRALVKAERESVAAAMKKHVSTLNKAKK